MGLFGKSKKEREKEYMNRLDVPLCLKEDFELIIDDVFTIMGVGTVAQETYQQECVEKEKMRVFIKQVEVY
uniref:hypothetical protein n=1 Tax=Gemmiger formicilis TaxID=745368 RepID=UPI00402A4ED5